MLIKSPLPAFRACLALLAVALGFCTGPSAQAGTLVTINTDLGSFQVDLYGDVATTTVDNFLSLVTGGNYTNTIIHRSVSDFVIQGGGYNLQNNAIANHGNIPLQYRMLNTRGTIAMARTNQPSTANSQWFINTANNTTTLAPRADDPTTPQNEFSEGYAVFGWVVSGMDVVDAIAALPKFNFSTRLHSAFGEIPLQNYTEANYNTNVPLTNANKVIVHSITSADPHPSYQNPIWNVDVNNSGTLSTADAISVVNSILTHGRRFAADESRITDTYKYFDTNGDGFVSTSGARKGDITDYWGKKRGHH